MIQNKIYQSEIVGGSQDIFCSEKNMDCRLRSFRLCGISKMASPKKQDCWPKINIHKGNHCILRIRGAPVRQKLGMILENKVVQKLKLEKNVFYKNGLLN